MTSPICPACSAKFPYGSGRDRCAKCGLPRNIATQGHAAVTRWKQGKYAGEEQPTKIFKDGAAGSKTRKRNRHGRKGVRA